jgi:hypothetical protein
VNIVIYRDIVVTVEPKRIALAKASEELRIASEKLDIVQKRVKELNAKLKKLTDEYDEANKTKQEAIATVEAGQKKLGLANRLINALASENVRWALNVKSMEADFELLVGDVLLASAFISYIGPFTKRFRAVRMLHLYRYYTQSNHTDIVVPLFFLFHLVPSRSISFHLVPSRSISFHFHLVPSRSISISFHLVPSRSISFQRNCSKSTGSPFYKPRPVVNPFP